MIVTCPSCASKYRVRDEAVPAEGAELQCPTCNTHFVAHPPRIDVDQIAATLEKVTRARDVAEARVQELEAQLARGADAYRQLQEEGIRLRASAADAVDAHRRMADEVARLRASAADAGELAQAKQQLSESQKRQKASAAEVEVANTLIATLKTEMSTLQVQATNPPALVQATQKAAALQAELDALRGRLATAEAEVARATASAARGPGVSTDVIGLIGAVGPMLWGLDQALAYLEQFADSEPTLAGHVKQLRLLQKVLTRLSEAAK